MVGIKGKSGGVRSGAGRPRKAVPTTEGKGIAWYHRGGVRPGDEDEDRGVPVNIQEIRKLTTRLTRDIRKRLTTGGAATISTQGGGADWVQSTVNYALTHSLYVDWPLVKSAVDWAIDTALENGYRIESEDQRGKEICDKLGEVLKLDTDVLPRWIWAYHVDGNVFDEVRNGTVEMLEGGGNFTGPVQLFPIPADQVRYKWKDAKGQEVEWGQVEQSGQVKPLKTETLLLQAWRPEGYDPYGTPIISSVLDDVETLITFQTDYRDIVKWYIKPLWHVKVGTAEKPASETLLASVKNNWEDREPDTDLITAGNIEIMEHGIGDKMPAVDNYLNYHDSKQTDGLQSPFIHVLRNASQASAGEIRDNTLSRVVFIQRFLKRNLEDLFRKVLEANNIKAVVRVVFQPLRALTLKDKMEFYLKLLNPQQVQFSEESRLEVEQKIRMELLGLPRDDSLKQVKEPMPGQQGLFGRVKNAITGQPSKEDQEIKQEKRALLRKLATKLSD